MSDLKEISTGVEKMADQTITIEPEQFLHDSVKHPNHYTWISNIESRDVAKHFSYHAGNAIKYIWRHQKKGSPIQDLRKAIRNLEYEVERLEHAKPPNHYTMISSIECRDVAKHFSYHAGNAMEYIWWHQSTGSPIVDLRIAIENLKYEIERLESEKSSNL